jgi:hypothetical protein
LAFREEDCFLSNWVKEICLGSLCFAYCEMWVAKGKRLIASWDFRAGMVPHLVSSDNNLKDFVGIKLNSGS